MLPASALRKFQRLVGHRASVHRVHFRHHKALGKSVNTEALEVAETIPKIIDGNVQPHGTEYWTPCQSAEFEVFNCKICYNKSKNNRKAGAKEKPAVSLKR